MATQVLFPIFLILLIAIKLYLGLITLRYSIDKVWLGGKWSKNKEGAVVPFKFVDDKVVGKIMVGTAQDGKDQWFNVDFNTLTDSFWLPSIDLCETRDCSTVQFALFSGSKSTTYEKAKRIFAFGTWKSYQDQLEARGYISRDHCQLGSGTKKALLPKQEFGEVNIMDGAIKRVDGIFGLNLISKWLYNEPPVLAMSKNLAVPAFGFFINKYQNEDGRLIIGGNDEKYFDGALNFHDVVMVDNVYNGWKIKIDKILVELKEGTIELKLNADAATVTPSIQSIVVAVTESQLISANNALFPSEKIDDCNQAWDLLPNVVIIMNEKRYVMTPKDYFVPETTGKCKLGMKYVTDANDFTLGRVFLKKFYTRFNIGTKQLQIAQARQQEDKVEPIQPGDTSV